MKRLIIFLSIAGAQFASTQFVSVLARAAAAAAAYRESAPWYLNALTRLASMLYFPIITLALYPRQLFPGDLILIPIAANSLLWAVVIVGAWRLIHGRRRGKN